MDGMLLIRAPGGFQSMQLHSLKALRALKRNLMASVLGKITLMVTLTVILVVPGLLSGSSVKFKLKIGTSKKLIRHRNFERRPTIPACFTVKAKIPDLIPDPALHLPRAELVIVGGAVARVNVSAA